ncbi:MAG: glycoside hydrolase family 130 protein [Lentisphaeria bacterium]
MPQLKLQRSPSNPLIRPADVPPSAPGFEVAGAFNPAAILHNDEVILLLRVAERCRQTEDDYIKVPTFRITSEGGIPETVAFRKDDPEVTLKDTRGVVYRGKDYLSTISHIRVARSSDGINFTVEPDPFIRPSYEDEAYGVEDARVVHLEDGYYINYTAVSAYGWCTALARTKNFQSYERLGIIFHPENKDVAIFPAKTGDKYTALHRPNNSGFGKPSIWYAESPDLLHWGGHRCIMTPRNTSYESMKIGGGSPPVKTGEGWFSFYHAKGDNSRYSLFPMLLDPDRPWLVKARAEVPALEPEADYETEGFFPDVVFTNGMLVRNDKINVYYGAADECCCLATVSLNEVEMFGK